VTVLPEASASQAPAKTVTLVANLKEEEIDELISALESMDAVGGRHLRVTVRDGFEISGVPENVAHRLEALLSSLGIEHYTLERSPVHVSGCHHLFNCPRDLVGTEQLADQLTQLVDATGVEKILLESVRGNVDPRSRLKIAVAGCTSCCNAPQVQDFGVMAKVRPEVTGTACEDGCTRCVDTCEDQAVTLPGGLPVVDSKRCIDCGQCVRVCPTGALGVKKQGYEIFEGGRLGRDPRVGQVAKDWAAWDEVEARLKRVLSDIAYTLEPAASEHIELKPTRAHPGGPTKPVAHAEKGKVFVPGELRVEEAD
jgi:dissimilatory sulfite reductase (desulfoviridin) alpha/beta subunit